MVTFRPCEAAAPVTNRERVEQSLGGMLVHAVTGVDDRNIEVAGNECGGARRAVAHRDAIRLHGIERAHRVQQGFALLEARGLRLQIHRIGAQTRSGRCKTDARTSGRLEKRQRYRLAAQRSQFLERVALKFLERFGFVQQKGDLLGGKRFSA